MVNDLKQAVDALSDYTFKGELNIPLRYFFSKNTQYSKVNLHVYEEWHPEIELNLTFRDYLRSNPEAQNEYAKLKSQLLQEESSHLKNNSVFTNYTLRKGDFIRKILNKAGFNQLRMLKCNEETEWEAYHRIREEQIFNPVNVAYDRNDPTLTSDNHHHFILYKGTNIVSIAHIEFLNENEAALRSFATDESFKNYGYEAHLMKTLERWLIKKERKLIKPDTNP